jgi:hypothetical protein
MNEKIKELAEQARIYSHSIHSDPWDRSKDWQDTYNEKFAELIVKECADYANYYQANSTYTDIGKAIKEQFGVKNDSR